MACRKIGRLGLEPVIYYLVSYHPTESKYDQGYQSKSPKFKYTMLKTYTVLQPVLKPWGIYEEKYLILHHRYNDQR